MKNKIREAMLIVMGATIWGIMLVPDIMLFEKLGTNEIESALYTVMAIMMNLVPIMFVTMVYDINKSVSGSKEECSKSDEITYTSKEEA